MRQNFWTYTVLTTGFILLLVSLVSFSGDNQILRHHIEFKVNQLSKPRVTNAEDTAVAMDVDGALYGIDTDERLKAATEGVSQYIISYSMSVGYCLIKVTHLCEVSFITYNEQGMCT